MMVIDKQKALELREQGNTYQEISNELSCSLDWCKRNLKGIKRKDISEEDFLNLISKGKGKDCITSGEIYSKLLPIPEDQDPKKGKKLALRRTKDKLKEDKEVIIRQSWIHPARARFSYNNMLMYINDLNDRIDEYVMQHLYECGFSKEQITDSLYNSTLYFMIKNSQFGTISNSYSQGVFEAINNSIEKIEERVTQIEPGIQPEDNSFVHESEIPY